eukprot:CAMPEP_0206186666 /NCGR_PEP_ID=MMETSP0166-20121206/2538_1 /ASSEMBLY_ACC=CAM_ASM_000260 /TAXON_ID=95228 /ORGANISM="Vannella robusta, Strain DIVA3 518/3/11/1/6" /LENGTH=272 /DNA_ID=CAMNT_0053602093 /DNA_START=1 /DNA_END=816 /DNA_ORIENTATION=+
MEDDWDDEEERLFTREFWCKFVLVVIFSVILGLFITQKVVIYFFMPTPGQDWPSPPTDVAIRQVKDGEIMLMWEPSQHGFVQHYRIYRYNNFLNKWNELEHSPTQKLGTKDTYLPSIWKNGTKIRYKVVAENKQNQSHPVELWFNIGYPYLHFDLPTSSLAPDIFPTPVRLLDISFKRGEEKIHIEWDRPPEKVLGYEVYRWNRITKEYDEVEHYDSIRNYSRSKMPNFPTEQLYCFAVKAVSWGDVGTSAPSYPRCIYIKNWVWELEELNR